VLGREALQVELGIEDAREVLIVTERGARVYAKKSPTKMRNINMCTTMPQPESGIAVSGHHYFAVPALCRRHATSTASTSASVIASPDEKHL